MNWTTALNLPPNEFNNLVSKKLVDGKITQKQMVEIITAYAIKRNELRKDVKEVFNT